MTPYLYCLAGAVASAYAAVFAIHFAPSLTGLCAAGFVLCTGCAQLLDVGQAE